MKNIIFKLIIFLIIVIILPGGCEVNNNNNISSQLIPLSEGNYWKYNNSYYFSKRIGGINTAMPITFRIGKAISLKNMQWFSFGFMDSANFCTNKKDGFYIIGEDEIVKKGKDKLLFNKASKLFNFPTKVGDLWLSKFSNYFQDTLITKSINKTINVQAGKFNCIHYQFKNLEKYPKSGFFVSSGIGLIKCELIMNIDSNQVSNDTTWNILELTKYKIMK